PPAGLGSPLVAEPIAGRYDPPRRGTAVPLRWKRPGVYNTRGGRGLALPPRRAGLLGQRRGGALALAVGVPLVVFLLLEGVGSVLMAARVGKSALYMREEAHARYDPDLGWSHAPRVHLDSFYGPGISLTTNGQGFRASEDYGATAP